MSTYLEPYSGTWSRAEAAHLGRRLLFGVTRENITMLSNMTMEQAVDSLLQLSLRPADPPAYITLGNVFEGMTWVNSQYEERFDPEWLWMLQSWWIGEILYQSVGKAPTITEKMTMFWHNHFATEASTVKDARYTYKQNALFRQHALGNFKDLVKAVTLDPAMLRFLNGSDNIKASPNENYARELQELFTIGKGTSGSTTTYTEGDIKQAARILTGWSDKNNPISVVFNSANHDSGDKQFSDRYGNTVIKGGSTEADARRELDDLLTMIFNQEETARYFVRKLYIWFVDYTIDSAIEQNIIIPLANILRNNNFNIKPVLETLFKSTHFYDESIRGSIIKNPIDFLLGTIRTFPSDRFYPLASASKERYSAWRTLQRTLMDIQLDILNPPNVAGWPAYWQKPYYYQLWVNSATLQKRTRFLTEVIINGYVLDENIGTAFLDVVQVAKQSATPDDINVIINDWCELAYPLPTSDEIKKELKKVVLNDLPDYEWTVEWNDYINNPGNLTKLKVVEDKLRTLLHYMVSKAEFQLS
ncbi:MAG: DUF1800 domain-containing protein [Bacteriodetes bacterium]|nr:DUF1800 domain-containing protein [Bacteroidota bacterium]